MEKITLEQCLNQTPCGERLLAVIVSELKEMSDNLDDKGTKKLKELYKVGNRLLTHDYYKEADKEERRLSKLETGKDLLVDLLSEDPRAEQILNARRLANQTKKIDYITFFNGLMDHIEEWC